jgi:hypothetical protein
MLLRRAEPGDAMDVARVHVRSWQAGYRGLLPDAILTGCGRRSGPGGTTSRVKCCAIRRRWLR